MKKILLIALALICTSSVFAKEKTPEEFTVCTCEFTIKEWVNIPELDIYNKEMQEIKDGWYWVIEEVPYVFDNIKFQETKFTFKQLKEKCLEYLYAEKMNSQDKTFFNNKMKAFSKNEFDFMAFRKRDKVFVIYMK